MNIGRIFVSAVVRRVAYVLVALLLAWLGLGPARAQTTNYPDMGAAYAACRAAWAGGAARCETSTRRLRPGSETCPHFGANTVGNYESRVQCENKNGTGNYVTQTLGTMTHSSSCQQRPNYLGSPPVSTLQSRPREGSISCINSCEAALFNNGDGTWTGYYSSGGGVCTNATLQQNCQSMAGMHWNGWNQTCEPNETECPANKIKDAVTGTCKDACPAGMIVNSEGQCSEEKDSCPAGQIKSPAGGCLPGEGQCAAGEAKRPDGTCGKDADGDGVADDDDDDPENDSEKNTFAGGENCDVPPSCSGDPIMCGQSRIQWRIDCNTRKNRSISGGGCAAMPICTGKNCDAMEYSQLLLQWRTACALEKAGGSTGGGTGNSDANIAAIKDAVTGTSQGDPGGEGNPQDGWQGGDGEGFEPDQGGYGWSSSCPANPQVSVFGHSLEFNLQPACSWISLGGLIAMAITALGCLRVVAGRAT